MDLSEIILIQEKFKKGFTIIVESKIDYYRDGIKGGYIKEGATGIITRFSEAVSRRHNHLPIIDYHILIRYLKDLEVNYEYFEEDNTGAISLIDIKEIIPPKDPNQLEFIFS